MNKKLGIIALFLTGFLLRAIPSLQAATYANIALDITLTGNIAMSISGSTYAALGSLPVSSAAVTATGITVVNDSDGITVNYSLKSYDSSPWTLQNTAGSDQFALRALFMNTASARPALTDFNDTNDKLTTSDITATTSGGSGLFEGDLSGAGVTSTSQRKIWFKVFTPTNTTSTGYRALTVTVTANLP